MLDVFEKLQREIDELVDEYHQAHARWTRWLAWAKRQPWFDLWQINEGLRLSDLRADVRSVAKAYRDIDFEQTKGMGIIYFASRKQIFYEKEQLKLRRSSLLKAIWFKYKKGKWVFSLSQIARAYGRTNLTTHKLLASHDWYETRESYRNRKFSTQHSRPIVAQAHLYGTKIT